MASTTANDVCHQWRRIAKDLSLISKLDLRSTPPLSTQSLKELLSFAANNLSVLKIRDIDPIPELGFLKRERPPVIVGWDSSGQWCPQDYNDLDELTKKAVNDWTIANKKSRPPVNQVMHILRTYNRRLKRLYLEDLSGGQISYDCLPSRLTHLSLLGGPQYEPHMDGSIFDELCPMSSYKFETIVYLNISHLNAFESQMCRSLNRFLSLKYLYMEGLFRVNSEGLSNIKLMPQLVVIDLDGTDTADTSFQFILNNCHLLEELYLGCTGVSGDFDASQSVAKQLKRLCLKNTRIVRRDVLNILQTHPSLESLICNQEIKDTIDSPILTTGVNNESNVTCLHYIIHNRFND